MTSTSSIVVLAVLMFVRVGLRAACRPCNSNTRCSVSKPEPASERSRHTKIPEEVLQKRQEQATRAEHAIASFKAGDHAAAISAIDDLIAEDPNDPNWHLLRARVWERRGDHAKAIADYEAAIQLPGCDPLAYNNLAWLLAASPDDALRDGEKGIELAVRFLEIVGDTDSVGLTTLAAAFAENGDFDRAVIVQQRVIELASDAALPAFRARLQLYETRRPFRIEIQQAPANESETGTLALGA